MKKTILVLAVLAFSLCAFSKDYNILLFGHSFGIDSSEHLPKLIVEAGIDNVRIARYSKGNCSLQERYTFFKENDRKGLTVCEPGQIDWEKEELSFKEMVSSRAWDVVVFQNDLAGEGLYETVQPYLNELVKYVKKVQKKKFKNEPLICWNLFWPISKILENSDKEPHHTRMEPFGHNTENAWNAYVQTARRIESEVGLKIIPTGTAIMNLRASAYNSPDKKEFTRDGYHLSRVAGRYAAACVWFEALIKPAFGFSIIGNSLRIPEANGSGDVTAVTDELAPILQKAAALAVENPYSVSAL